MPDWTAPFHAPELTDEQYARRKAEYVAKYGHTITIPGLSDIIKIPIEDPMTALESYWWKKKMWDQFSPGRLEELRKQKQKRKDRYLARLASPTPAIAQNAGSILTAFDDAQDAIVSLAAIGSLARKVAPKLLGKLLRGPTGVLLATSDILNLVQSAGTYCMLPLHNKNAGEELARGSPRNIKHKLKKRMRMAARLPTKSDWIQGLQTTEQVFGFGVSLGPIVGLAQDIVWASVRARPGVFVDIKFPVPDLQDWFKKAQRMAKSIGLMWGMHYETDDEDILFSLAAAHLTFQQLPAVTQQWNPLDNIDDIETLELRAPLPWHVLTQEVIAEGPVASRESFGWPQTNTLWATIRDIADRTQDVAAQNLDEFQSRNKHSWAGYVGGLCAAQAAPNLLACIEGENDVYYDHTSQLKASLTMIKHACMLDPNQPDEKFTLFEAFLDDCEEALWDPTMEDILQFCRSPWNDIKLIPTHVSRI